MTTMRVAPSERISYADLGDAMEDFFARGWTDGLPVVPPTVERVAQFLERADLAPNDVVGEVPTRDATVTAELAAVNAVMAGCRPEYFPVVVAALRAHLSPLGNSHCTTGTVTGAAHVLIVNGPVRREIGIASGQACMGPGFRANATIGRAFRLTIRNACQAVPGVLDLATFSSPLRYSFCFGENEEGAAPWVPLHVQRGLNSGQSAVTVATVLNVLPVDSLGRTPRPILEDIARAIRTRGAMTTDDFLEDNVGIVIVVGAEHMRLFHRAGWSKQALQAALWAMLARDSTSATDLSVRWPNPDCLLVVAAGGPGLPETQVIFPHLGAPLTEPVAAGRDSAREDSGLDRAVTRVIAKFQKMLGEQGATIALTEITSTAAHFDLEIVGVDCAECVMPRATLEEIVLHRLSEAAPGITRVTIADPRESSVLPAHRDSGPNPAI